MRTVFSNSEIVHVWAAQDQYRDHGKANSMSFSGDTLYSYAAKIAKITGGVALLIDRSWSVTTSAHQGLARAAVSHLKKFTVASLKPDHAENVRHYESKIKNSFERHFRARSRKVSIFEENHALHRELIDYANHFEVKYSAGVGHYVLSDIDHIMEAQLQQHKEQEAKDRKAAKEGIEKVESAWIDGKSGKTFVVCNNKRFVFSYIRVRKSGNEIESSLGARVPIKEARVLYKAIKAGKPVHGMKIGYYTVTGLNGTLRIGCHEIQRKEVDRLAAVLGW